MEMVNKQEILQSIGKVYEQANGCKLENSFIETLNHELQVLSQYFGTSEIQALFIAVIFTLNYKGGTVNYKELIEYFDCNPMKILEYNDDFQHLHTKGIFGKRKSGRPLKLAGAKEEFYIHEKITDAILQSQPMPKTEDVKIESVVSFLEKIQDFGIQRNKKEISSSDLFEETDKMIDSNIHFPLVEKVKQFKLSTNASYLYFYLIWKTISGYESVDISSTLETMYDDSSERLRHMQKILSGKSVLTKNNLVEIEEARFFNDTEMKLTDTSLQLLNDCGIQLFLNKKKKDNIIIPSEIVYRELVFDKDEMNQLDTLQDLLQEAKFNEVQTRLSNKSLPKGIAVLLHGAPGTGKTEIVKQLAKVTGRDIMKVEICESKSMWFGESEKIVKRIFTDYKAYSKECKLTPILLFNEADAIISKRKENSNSTVAQTENTIQNILLEELENFEGILIATTNLASNMDTAFERRFLFKVEFKKPSVAVKSQIWKSKMPHLSNEDCELLSSQFDFSGGQIDNIVRKNEINEIVHGNKVDVNTLVEFCKEETLSNQFSRIQIGFKRNN